MAKINVINNAAAELTLDPGASGDSFVQFDINTTGKFRLGVDDDAADALKLSQGSALGANDTWIMTAAGERTMPLQSAFLAVLTGTDANVTGDSTTYTIINWDTKVFDQNSDFNATTGIFTAPVTGRYAFESVVKIEGAMVAAHDEGSPCRITTSNNVFLQRQINPNLVKSVNDEVAEGVVAFGDMDAADTAFIQSLVGVDTKIVSVLAGTYFSGNLEA